MSRKNNWKYWPTILNGDDAVKTHSIRNVNVNCRQFFKNSVLKRHYHKRSIGSDRDSENPDPGLAESGRHPRTGDPDKENLIAFKVEIDQKTQYISS
jgi:hypothetical protein